LKDIRGRRVPGATAQEGDLILCRGGPGKAKDAGEGLVVCPEGSALREGWATGVFGGRGLRGVFRVGGFIEKLVCLVHEGSGSGAVGWWGMRVLFGIVFRGVRHQGVL